MCVVDYYLNDQIPSERFNSEVEESDFQKNCLIQIAKQAELYYIILNSTKVQKKTFE